MDREDWNNVYVIVMPLLGIAISAVGVAISVLRLRQGEAAGVGSLELPTGIAVDIPRVHYQDSQILLSVRNPGEWQEIREFIRPDDPILTHAIVEALSG